MKYVINNDMIYIDFEESEKQYMMQMLEEELNENFEEINNYLKETKKALKNKDTKKLSEIERESHCLFGPELIKEKIDRLKKTKQYIHSFGLLGYSFINKLKNINNREFIENFKELIRIEIEQEKFEFIKKIHLEELNEI